MLKLEVDFHVGKKQLKQILEKVFNVHGATRAAITLKGVLSMLGVFTAASRRPSMASSRIRNCQIKGTLVGSFTAMNSKPVGIHSGLCIRSKKVGVIK